MQSLNPRFTREPARVSGTVVIEGCRQVRVVKKTGLWGNVGQAVARWTKIAWVSQAIRIKLDPILVEQSGGEMHVVGGQLTFTTFGAEPTHATGAPQKAELVFEGRLMARARKPTEVVKVEFPKLGGELWVEGDGSRVQFKCDPESIDTWQKDFAQALKQRKEPFLILPKELTLQLPSATFVDIDELLNGRQLKLVIPKHAEAHRYLEISATLRIADQIEAKAELNDVLDVELRRVRRADVQIFVFDERGLRMPGTQYRVTTPDEVRVGTTDAEGAINESKLIECDTFFLEWGEDPDIESPAKPAFLFARYVAFLPSEEGEPEVAIRLRNLGYVAGTESDSLTAFAREYKRDVSEEGDPKLALMKVHDEGRKLRLS